MNFKDSNEETLLSDSNEQNLPNSNTDIINMIHENMSEFDIKADEISRRIIDKRLKEKSPYLGKNKP